MNGFIHFIWLLRIEQSGVQMEINLASSRLRQANGIDNYVAVGCNKVVKYTYACLILNIHEILNSIYHVDYVRLKKHITVITAKNSLIFHYGFLF